MSQDTAARKKEMGSNLTEGKILRTLLTFAIPIILTSVVQQLYSTVDLIVIGQFVGSAGTSGVSTGGEFLDLMTPVATAFATAGQIYIAQLAGAKAEERIKDTVGTLITMMLGTAVACMLIALLFHTQILTLLNCPEEAFSYARSYMLITAIGVPFVFGYNAICAILRGMGESRSPLFFIIVAAVINIFLDLIFVVLLDMQAAGTAIATVCSQIGSCIAAFWFMYKHRHRFDFELKLSYLRIKKEPALVILRIGIPTLIRILLVNFSMLWVKSGINSYGLVASATNSIGNKIQKLLIVMMQGVETASGTMIGQNLGGKKLDRARRTVWTTLACSLCLAVICAGVVLLFPRELFRIFTNDEEVITFGRIFMRVMAVDFMVSAFTGSLKSMVTGAGAVTLSFIIGILDGVICRIGISLFCVNVLDMGAVGYFWGTALCQVLPGLVCLWYVLSGRWKRKSLVE